MLLHMFLRAQPMSFNHGAVAFTKWLHYYSNNPLNCSKFSYTGTLNCSGVLFLVNEY